jgi:hypothetical protein
MEPRTLSSSALYFLGATSCSASPASGATLALNSRPLSSIENCHTRRSPGARAVSASSCTPPAGTVTLAAPSASVSPAGAFCSLGVHATQPPAAVQRQPPPRNVGSCSSLKRTDAKGHTLAEGDASERPGQTPIFSSMRVDMKTRKSENNA